MLFSIATTLFNGCKKDDDEKYQPKGNYGTGNGNANVTGTNTVTFTSGDWNVTAGVLYDVEITVPGITQSIVDNGIVMVYEKSGSVECVPLPYTETNISKLFTFGVGYVDILIESTDGTPIANPGTVTYRVAFISAAGIKKITDNNVDINNYSAVKQVLQIAD